MPRFRNVQKIPEDRAILAYAAGILDGEGCIRIKATRRNGRSIYSMAVVVGNTNEAVLVFLNECFGGTIHPTRRAKTKPFGVWEVNGTQAFEFLLALVPFLIIKRAQAIVAIRFGASKQAKRKVTPESIVRYQGDLKQEMHLLNARWKSPLKAVGE